MQDAVLALEKYASTVYNVRTFGGAKADGSDDTPAFNACLAAIPNPAGGGTIYVPPGVYNLSTPLLLNSKRYIRIVGAGPSRTGGAATSSLIRFNGTTGPLVQGASSTGIELSDLYVQWPSTFTGTVVDYSNATFPRLNGCFFGSNGGGSVAAAIVGFDSALAPFVDLCQFHNAQVGIQGLSNSSHFSNAGSIRRSFFNSLTGDVAVAGIQNPGNGWDISNNVFEMGQAAGTQAAIAFGGGFSAKGLILTGNWFGDTGGTAVSHVTVTGSGWTLKGNYIGGSANSTAVAIANNASGISVQGNFLDTHSIGISIGTGTTGLVLGPNGMNAVTTAISGTPGAGSVLLTTSAMQLFQPLQVPTPALAGQTGAIYQGSGAPNNANGNNGDYYFRTDTPGTANQRLYVKSAGTWTGIV